MENVYQPAKSSLEEEILQDLSPDVPWALIERFTTLFRKAGSEDERTAAHYITDQLSKFDIPHEWTAYSDENTNESMIK